MGALNQPPSLIPFGEVHVRPCIPATDRPVRPAGRDARNAADTRSYVPDQGLHLAVRPDSERSRRPAIRAERDDRSVLTGPAPRPARRYGQRLTVTAGR